MTLQQTTAPASASAPGSQIILTGDRPTGPLHLGHFVGSLRDRVTYQHQYRQFVMLADSQALTDNMGDVLMRIRPGGVVVYISPAIEQMVEG